MVTLNSGAERFSTGVSTAQPYSYRDSRTVLEIIKAIEESIIGWQDDIDKLRTDTAEDIETLKNYVNSQVATFNAKMEELRKELIKLIRQGGLTGLFYDPTDGARNKALNVVNERIYMFANVHGIFAQQYGNITAGEWDGRGDTARQKDTHMTNDPNSLPEIAPILVTR